MFWRNRMRELMVRELVINGMCSQFNPDFELVKPYPKTEEERNLDVLDRGLYDHERSELWRTMAKVFDNCIWPYMKFRDEPNWSEKIPKD